MTQDHDYYNTVVAENRQEMREINQRKNKILSISSQKRKQEAWTSLFPKLPESDMVY